MLKSTIFLWLLAIEGLRSKLWTTNKVNWMFFFFLGDKNCPWGNFGKNVYWKIFLFSYFCRHPRQAVGIISINIHSRVRNDKFRIIEKFPWSGQMSKSEFESINQSISWTSNTICDASEVVSCSWWILTVHINVTDFMHQSASLEIIIGVVKSELTTFFTEVSKSIKPNFTGKKLRWI